MEPIKSKIRLNFGVVPIFENSSRFTPLSIKDSAAYVSADFPSYGVVNVRESTKQVRVTEAQCTANGIDK